MIMTEVSFVERVREIVKLMEEKGYSKTIIHNVLWFYHEVDEPISK